MRLGQSVLKVPIARLLGIVADVSVPRHMRTMLTGSPNKVVVRAKRGQAAIAALHVYVVQDRVVEQTLVQRIRRNSPAVSRAGQL